MAEYSDRIDVAAPADAVFAFISDIGNLPKYLPTVQGAHAHGADRRSTAPPTATSMPRPAGSSPIPPPG